MDIFIGTLANAGLVILGTVFGLLFRKIKKADAIGERLIQVFSVFILAMGVQGVDFSEPIKLLVCLVIGVALGEFCDIDNIFNKFGDFLQNKLPSKDGISPSHAMISATLIFCIGSMTFLGAIESGISHTHTIYITKGVIDAVTAFTMTISMGWGIGLSSIAVLFYQGALVLLASFLGDVLLSTTITLCVSIGSLLLILIGLNLLGVTKVKVANMLPAMFIPMILQIVFQGV